MDFSYRSSHSKLPALDILCEFNKAYENSAPSGYALFYQQLLCAARDHNHTELVTLLSSDGHFNGLDVIVIQSPLTVAVLNKNTNLSVIERLLRKGSFLTLTLKCPFINLSRPTVFWRDTIFCQYVSSVIEQPCVMDQPEILEMLLSYDTDQNRERYETYNSLLNF